MFFQFLAWIARHTYVYSSVDCVARNMYGKPDMTTRYKWYTGVAAFIAHSKRKNIMYVHYILSILYIHVNMYMYVHSWFWVPFHRALLDKEVSQTAQLRNEQLATQDVISQLETEVKGLQTLLSSVTSELEEAQSRLTEYKQTEDSLERSAHTISSLHQVCLNRCVSIQEQTPQCGRVAFEYSGDQ